jgi:hypothetical protein
MKKKLLLTVFLLSFCVAEEAKKASYEPTHEQHLELENAQLRAQLAQQQAAKAQDNFKLQIQLLKSTCKAVATTNKWPETVDCDIDTLNFADTKQVKK